MDAHEALIEEVKRLTLENQQLKVQLAIRGQQIVKTEMLLQERPAGQVGALRSQEFPPLAGDPAEAEISRLREEKRLHGILERVSFDLPLEAMHGEAGESFGEYLKAAMMNSAVRWLDVIEDPTRPVRRCQFIVLRTKGRSPLAQRLFGGD